MRVCRDVERTIRGGLELSVVSKVPFETNSDWALSKRLDGAAPCDVYERPSSRLNERWQSNETKRLTITSPTSNSGPMPPPVPVVMTNDGWQSSMICRQTRALGSFGPSCDKCESDLK